MIEKILLDYLSCAMSVPVYPEVPEAPPAEYIIIEKTGGRIKDHICSAVIAIRSVSTVSLHRAAMINEEVKTAMDGILVLPEIFRASLNSDYNFTNVQTKEYRYQAVYDMTY